MGAKPAGNALTWPNESKAEFIAEVLAIIYYYRLVYISNFTSQYNIKLIFTLDMQNYNNFFVLKFC